MLRGEIAIPIIIILQEVRPREQGQHIITQ
jgi:hypothetical protein